ncbi:MAG: phosphotransferase [Nanoarchaeota archaeon]|nr:phosphotransferase [Nanoarchaeota archaeon]
MNYVRVMHMQKGYSSDESFNFLLSHAGVFLSMGGALLFANNMFLSRLAIGISPSPEMIKTMFHPPAEQLPYLEKKDIADIGLVLEIRASQCEREGNKDGALWFREKRIMLGKKYQVRQPLFYKPMQYSTRAILGSYNQLNENPRITELLMQMYGYAGDIKKMEKYLARVVADVPEKAIEQYIVGALQARAFGDYTVMKRLFRKSLDIIMDKDKASFEHVGVSRNEVLAYTPFSSQYIFKKGDDQLVFRESVIANLHRECYMDHLAQAIFDMDTVPIEESLGLFDKNDQQVLVTRRMPKKSLDVLLAEGKDCSADMKLGMQHLVELMSFSTPHYVPDAADIPHRYGEEFSRRVVRRLKDNASAGVFLEQYASFASRLDADRVRLPVVLAHRDAAVANVLEGGYLIDFETAGRADPVLDCATLLASARQYEEFVPYTTQLLTENFSIPSTVDITEFLDRARVHNALCQLAVSIERQVPEKVRNFYQVINSGLQKYDASLKETFSAVRVPYVNG